MRGKLQEAEEEIKRLTKTVKIVEVEVKGDTQPLHNEIDRLREVEKDLLTQIGILKPELEEKVKRVEELVS